MADDEETFDRLQEAKPEPLESSFTMTPGMLMQLLDRPGDAVLILAGTFGLSALLQAHPLAMEITRWGGVLFLLLYASQALWRALSPRGLEAMRAPARSRRAVLLTTLAVTLLNPHVYLDTMVLIGSLAAQQGMGRPHVCAAVPDGLRQAAAGRAAAAAALAGAPRRGPV